MSTAWEEVTERAEQQAEQGGLFVKLKNDGDKVVGAFVGDPFARDKHWVDNSSVECEGEGCPHCEKKRPSMKISLNFYVPEENAMKIIEGGVKWFKGVVKVREKYGFDNWLFEIERHGEAGSTKTSYSILPEKEMDEALKERIAITDLNDLEKVTSGQKDEEETTQKGEEDEKINPKAHGEMTAQLKVLGMEKVTDFLNAFGIQKISDLAAKDEKKARSYITSLGQENEEVDPFA